MPLYKRITVNPHTKVLIWKIQESFEDLSRGICLTPHCEARVGGTKSDIHRRGFMSVRHLLAEEGYTDKDLVYDEYGKQLLPRSPCLAYSVEYHYRMGGFSERA